MTLSTTPEVSLPATHQRRLREVWRSAGWPCHDAVEAELLVAGLLERVGPPQALQTLRVTDAGLAAIAATLRRNRARRDPHEALVERVAREMTRAGRLAWRGLGLRARVPGAAEGEDGQWVVAMPDVVSIRNTTVEGYLEPVVHEIKVQRSDLLADLKRAAKRAAYLQLAGECWYVLREGIAEPQEVPAECGVLLAREAGALEVARPAPRRACRLPFGVWMALARATPLEGWRAEEAQAWLGDPDAAA